MKKIIILLVVAMSWIALFGVAQAAFPERPINVIVYLKPGGAGDVFVRRFEKIAAKYTKAQFVVINKPGAGGAAWMKRSCGAGMRSKRVFRKRPVSFIKI